jgi:hypothetical protein
MEKAQNENRRQSSLFSSVCMCLCVNFACRCGISAIFITGIFVFAFVCLYFEWFKRDVRRVDQNKLLLLLFVLSG